MYVKIERGLIAALNVLAFFFFIAALVVAMFFAVIDGEVFPVVFMLLFAAFWGWVSVLHLKVRRCIWGGIRKRAYKIDALRVQCIVLTGIMLWCTFTMLTVWLAMLWFIGLPLFSLGLNFLFVAIVSGIYAFGCASILKLL